MSWDDTKTVSYFLVKKVDNLKKKNEKWGYFTCEKCLGIGIQYLEENKERLLKMARERYKGLSE